MTRVQYFATIGRVRLQWLFLLGLPAMLIWYFDFLALRSWRLMFVLSVWVFAFGINISVTVAEIEGAKRARESYVVHKWRLEGEERKRISGMSRSDALRERLFRLHHGRGFAVAIPPSAKALAIGLLAALLGLVLLVIGVVVVQDGTAGYVFARVLSVVFLYGGFTEILAYFQYVRPT